MQNHAGTVAQVLASQFSNPVVSSADEETGKAQLTRAAAYEIAKSDPAVGLRSKTSGNQVANLSVDTIVDRTTGQVVDIATSRPEGPGQVRILPGWYDYGPNVNEIPSYVQPTAALAALPGPMPRTGIDPGPGPGPDPGPGPGPDNDAVLAALEDVTATQAVHTELLEQLRQQAAANTARIIERDDYNTERILGELNRLSEEFQATAKQVLALWLAQQGRPPLTPDESGSLVETVFTQLKAKRDAEGA